MGLLVVARMVQVCNGVILRCCALCGAEFVVS